MKRGSIDVDRLEVVTLRTINANAGTVDKEVVGNRHGVRTVEYLYHWQRDGHIEYGFQVHFVLREYCFSIQLNSRDPLAKDSILMVSRFADSVRIL